MIGYHEALARMREGARLLAVQQVALAAATGRVLGRDVVSGIALPPFDNAAMDGVALASGAQPQAAGSEWELAARIGAGDMPRDDAASAWEIMTGAPLPARADIVVPVERIEALAVRDAGAPRIRLLAQAEPGANIRRRGEDVPAGCVVLKQGTFVGDAQMLLLAGLGIDRVDVARRPRVAVLATGRELVAQGQPLPPGGIHDATSPYLAAALATAGAEAVRVVRVGDEVADFQAALDTALADGVDLVLSTGAVSKGHYDFIPSALDARGAERRFHGVALRPGKPVFCARLREGPLCVGLPGNPLSTAVGFRFLVEPLLRAWLGMSVEQECRLPLATACSKRAGLHAAFHATLRCDEEGCMRVHVGAEQASFRLLPFSQSSAWITLPAEAEHVEAGTRVQVHGYSHLRPPPWIPA
ncbi:molybdopterin molybdotransferase MoeA [Pseudoxanthomonas sp. LARHCG66]